MRVNLGIVLLGKEVEFGYFADDRAGNDIGKDVPLFVVD